MPGGIAMSGKIEVWEIDSLDTKAALPTFGKAQIKATQVEVSVLSSNLKEVIKSFQAVLDEQSDSTDGYYIDEIELNLVVKGNGSIALIGKLEAGVEAGIKVKLKRKFKN
jgi:hypothetical protein